MGNKIILLALSPFLATLVTISLEIVFKLGNIVGTIIRNF